MRSTFLLLCLLLGTAFSSTCSKSKQYTKIIPTTPENVFTLSIMSSVTTNDVVLWRRSSTNEITIETTLYSDFQDELDSVYVNTSLTGNTMEVNYASSYVPAATTGAATTAGVASTTVSTEGGVSKASSIPFSSLLFTVLAAFTFHKNSAAFNFALIVALVCLFQPSFAPCPSSAIIRVYVPDNVKVLCDNGKCISNTAVAGLGVNIHWTHPKVGETEMLQEAFRMTRMDFSWGTEYAAGQYYFGDYDALYNATSPFNVSNYWILDYSNSLYDGGLSPSSDAGRTAMANWAKAATQHFAGKNIFWEMYNEPNIGFWKPTPNTTAYVLMSNAVGAAISDNEIFFGPASSQIDLTFLEDCFAMGTLQYWDAVSVHPYRQKDPETVQSEYYNLRRLITKYKPSDKLAIPIFSGEWGYSTAWPGVSYNDSILSTYIVREYMVNLLNEVPVSIWYDWHDDGTDPVDPEAHFGSVFYPYNATNNPVYAPKLQYTAAYNLHQYLSQKTFNKRLIVSASSDDYVLLFNSNADDAVFVVWTSSFTNVNLQIPCSSGSFVITDYLKRSTSNANCQSVSSRDPVYVTVANDDLVRIMASSSRLLLESFTNVGYVDLDVNIENPTSSDISVNLLGNNAVTIAAGEAAKLTERVNFYRTQSQQVYPVTVVVQGLGNFTIATLLGTDFPLLVTPISQTADSITLLVDNSGQPFNGYINVTVISPVQSQGQKSITFNLNDPATPFTIPLTGSQLTYGTPITISGTVTDTSGNLEGNFATTFVVSDSYDATTLTHYKVIPDGNSSIYSTQNLTFQNPPGGSPQDIGVFQLSYYFAPGWKFVRVSKTVGSNYINSTNVNQIAMWIYGDGSGNSVRFRIYDKNSQYFQPLGPSLNWTGWKLVIVDVFTSNTGYWNGNGTPVYPLYWDTYLLIDGPRTTTQGTLYFSPPVILS